MAVQPSEKSYSIPNVQFCICAKPGKTKTDDLLADVAHLSATWTFMDST